MLMAYDGVDKLGDEDEHWAMVHDITELLSDIRDEDKRARMPVVDQLLRRPTSSVVFAHTYRGMAGNYSTEESFT